MKEDYEIEQKKQAAADVLFHYSKFVMACIGNQVRPCDLRLHIMKLGASGSSSCCSYPRNQHNKDASFGAWNRELLKGPLYYASTICLACAIYWRSSPIAIATICNLCAGDGFADIVGRRFGTTKIPYNTNKSIAGSIAMAAAGFIASIGYMHYFAMFGYIEESWKMVFQIIKTAILTATDLTGLTKGKIRPFSLPIPPSNTNATQHKDSVVYFENNQPLDSSNKNTSSSLDSSTVSIAVEEKKFDSNGSSSPSSAASSVVDDVIAQVGGAVPVPITNASSNDNGGTVPNTQTPSPLVQKRRKPGERRVPSTPFSRAMGFAGLGAVA